MSTCTQISAKPYLINTNLKLKAGEYINEDQEVYVQDLINWLQEDFPEACPNDIQYSFLQLMREGYFFSKHGYVYPSVEGHENERKLTKFSFLLKLDEMVLEILLTLNEMGNTATSLHSLSSEVILENPDYDELDVKCEINILLIEGLIVYVPSDVEPEYLNINWGLVEEVVG